MQIYYEPVPADIFGKHAGEPVIAATVFRKLPSGQEGIFLKLRVHYASHPTRHVSVPYPIEEHQSLADVRKRVDLFVEMHDIEYLYFHSEELYQPKW